jgi:hypothetical protein
MQLRGSSLTAQDHGDRQTTAVPGILDETIDAEYPHPLPPQSWTQVSAKQIYRPSIRGIGVQKTNDGIAADRQLRCSARNFIMGFPSDYACSCEGTRVRGGIMAPTIRSTSHISSPQNPQTGDDENDDYDAK